jgi:hypothetical protein
MYENSNAYMSLGEYIKETFGVLDPKELGHELHEDD